MVLKKSFAARRVPRVISQDEDEHTDAPDSSEQTGSQESEPRPVIRPSLNKPKKRSALRLSFGPDEANSAKDGEDSDEEAVQRVVRPTVKKPGGARQSLGRKLELRNLPSSSEDLPLRGMQDEKPSYSKEYLDELRQSTPVKPRKEVQGSSGEDGAESARVLDIAKKFGPGALDRSSHIPSEAEIREKKARRARMAKENEFISLEPNSDDEADRLQMEDDDSRDLMRRAGVFMEDKYDNPDSRLVRDNEDFAEGFEEYVEDGKISLGRKAEREAAAKKRAEMAAMIDDAEAGSPNQDTSDSEAERNAAYDAAQTKAGTYGMSSRAAGRSQQRQPPNIRPLPDLDSVAARVKRTLDKMREGQAMRMQRLQELREEKKTISEREVYIQAQLKETAERYEKLRIEAGMASGAGTPMNGDGPKMILDRGLETMGATPTNGTSDEEEEETTHRGLGA